MAIYTGLPTLYIDFFKAGRMIVDVQGAGIDGGRNGEGDSPAIDFSGGGKIVASYEGGFTQSPEEHEYLNWLAARLNNSIRCINVPILTDWSGPFPVNGQGIPQPFVSGIPHSDGSMFSDGSGYSQATVWAVMRQSAALNAGEIKIRVYDAARRIRWSEWFSINHDVKGWRAFRNWETAFIGEGTEMVSGGLRTYQDYDLAVSPPLRQAVTAGTRVELARPRFVGRFPRDFTLAWDVEGFWRSRPTVKFVEAEVR